MQKLVRFFAACAAVMIASSAFATSYTWNSSVADGNWDDAANWESSDGGTTYPSSSSDVAVFAAGTTASVKLTTARTIGTLNLSAANVKLTLTQGGASLSASKLTVTALTISGENLDFTLDGVSVVANNKPMMGSAGKLSILNGSYFSSGVFYNQAFANSKMAGNAEGGKIYIAGGSTVGMTGLHLQNGLLEIDDSTFNLAYGFRFWNDTSATTIRLKGKHPLIKMTLGEGEAYSNANGCNVHFEFVIPEGGYTEAPIQSGSSSRKFPSTVTGTDKTGSYTFDVSSDSPAKLAGESLTSRLISWAPGFYQNKITFNVNLPQTSDTYSMGTTTLDVTLKGSPITIASKTENGRWQGIDLGFGASENARELHVAYGATDGGKDTAAWDHTAKLADLATDATTYNYLFAQTTDATWGSDDFKFVRFYILANGVKVWTDVTEWVSLSKSAALITVSGYSGATTLTDFPVLVRISPETISGFSYAACAANGADIAFTSVDGATVYKHEIDTWNPNGESTAWVRVPTLAGKTTSFLMTWGDSAVTETTSTSATWNDNYIGVWHMGEASGTCANSTSLGSDYDAMTNGTAAANQTLYDGGDAPVGGARRLSTTYASSYLEVTNAVQHGSVFTVSAWIRITSSTQNYPRLFGRKSYYTDANGWELEMNNDSWENFNVRGASSASVSGSFTKNFKWRHVTAVYNNTTVSVYADGALVKSGAIAAATDNTVPIRFCGVVAIGASIDEARLMKGAASADWVKADYDTVNAADFLTYGKATSADALPIVIALSQATATKHEATIAYEVSAFGSGATKLTAVGLEYGTSADALTSSASFGEVSATGAQTGTASGLLPQTTYYARLVATNDQGATFAGDVFSFTTDTYLPSASVSLNGVGGDTIVVGGTVAAFDSEKGCTLTILTGASADALSNEWSGLAGSVLSASAESQPFSLSLCETDATSPRYIAPGSSVYVAVKAKIGDWEMQTPATKVTTTQQPTLGTVSVSCPRRTATFSVPVSNVGMTGGVARTTLTLYIGTAANVYDVSTNTLEVTAAKTYKFENVRLPTFGSGNYYTVVASNVSAGGSKTNTVSKSGTVTAKDVTTYTWTGGGAAGVWEDAANWTDDNDGDCLGWPKSSGASVDFESGTDTTILFTNSYAVANLYLTNANVKVAFKKGEVADGAATPTLTVATKADLSGTNNVFTIDGMAMSYVSKSLTLGSNSVWRLTNGASVTLTNWGTTDESNVYNNGGKILVEDSSFACARYYMSLGAMTHVKSINGTATFTARGRTMWNSTDAANPDTIRIEGANASYKMGWASYAIFAPQTASAILNLDFVVPRGGWASAPLVVTSKPSSDRPCGYYNYVVGKVNVNLIAGDASSKTVTTPLISWPDVGIKKSVFALGAGSKKSVQLLWKDAADPESADSTSEKPKYLYGVLPGSAGLMLIIR